MLNQKTSQDSPNVISSLVSAVGHTPCALQEFPTTTRAGQEAHLANHSAQLVSNSDSLTKGISRQPLCASLTSASLQSSLANKLRQRLENTGSTIYSLSWKDKVTPAGRQYCQRAASAPRTKETGCSLVPWATATTRGHKDTGDLSNSFFRKDGKMRNDTLYRQMWMQTFGVTGKPSRELMKELECYQSDMARGIMGYPPEWDDCAVTAMP